MNLPKFLIFNWKQTASFSMLKNLLDQRQFLTPKWNFYLACQPRFWFTQSILHFCLIGQNFAFLPFPTYYFLVLTAFKRRRLDGLLLNHPQNHFRLQQQQQLIELCQVMKQTVFYCFGKNLDFSQSRQTNFRILISELHQLSALFAQSLLTPILILEPLNSSATVFTALKQLRWLIRFLKDWWQIRFQTPLLVGLGGGITTTNAWLVAFMDGFIVGRNSKTKVNIQRWGKRINVTSL